MEQEVVKQYVLSIDPGTRNFGLSLVDCTDPDQPLVLQTETYDLTSGVKEAKYKAKHGKHYSLCLIRKAKHAIKCFLEGFWDVLHLQMQYKQGRVYKWPIVMSTILIEKTKFCKFLVYGMLSHFDDDGAWIFGQDPEIHLIDPRKVKQWAFPTLGSGPRFRQQKKDLTPVFVSQFVNIAGTEGEHEVDCLLNTIYFLKHMNTLFKPCAVARRISSSHSSPEERPSEQTMEQELCPTFDSSPTTEKAWCQLHLSSSQ